MKNLVLLITLFFVTAVNGQSTQSRIVINEYVDYLNLCNRYMSASHFSVKEYNLKMNQLFEDPSDYKSTFSDGQKIFELAFTSAPKEKQDQLSLAYIWKAYDQLILSIESLPSPLREKIKKSSEDFQLAMKIFANFNESFETKNKQPKSFFEDSKNKESVITELENYKGLVAEMADILQVIAKDIAGFFNETNLPIPMVLLKNKIKASKDLVGAMQTKDAQIIESSIKNFEHILGGKALGTEYMKMESFGDFGYTDNHNTQQRGNIERAMFALLKEAKELLKEHKYATNFSYGVRTYSKVLNIAEHKEVYKMERLAIWLNDLSSDPNTIIGGYSQYIERANKPMLKMLDIVIPFAVIEFEIKEKKEDKPNEIKDTMTVVTKIISIEEPAYFQTLGEAKPNNLVLLLDVSASMQKESKLGKLKISISHLIDLLREEDKLSVIIFSSSPKVLFSSEGHFDKAELKSKITSLRSQGGTNTKKGLQKAYELCEQTWIPEGNNRIIIATDGTFKIDRKDKRLIKTKAKNHINLSTFHYQSNKVSSFKETTLKLMAKLGQGDFKVIQDEQDAVKALVIEAKK